MAEKPASARRQFGAVDAGAEQDASRRLRRPGRGERAGERVVGVDALAQEGVEIVEQAAELWSRLRR